MKWSGSLQSRLMAASLLPVSVLTLLVGVYMITQYREMLANNLQQRGQLLARQLAVAADYGVFSGNTATLLSLAQSVDLIWQTARWLKTALPAHGARVAPCRCTAVMPGFGIVSSTVTRTTGSRRREGGQYRF